MWHKVSLARVNFYFLKNYEKKLKLKKKKKHLLTRGT